MTPEEFFHLEKTDPRLTAAMRQVGLRARDHFLAARKAPKPRAALAAILPAALVPVYLRKMDARRADPSAADGVAQRGDEEAALAVSPTAPRGSPLLCFTSPWLTRR